MGNKRTIIVINALCIQHQFVQIVYVLLDDSRNVFKLSQLVTIVLGEHALRADYLVAKFAKILNFFLRMAPTEHFLRRLLSLLLLLLYPCEENGVLLLMLMQSVLILLGH